MSDHHRFEVDGDARLVVGVPSGRMDLHGTEGEIEIEITGNTEGIEVAESGNTVTVSAQRGSGVSFGSVRLRVGVPEGCDLELSGASLDVFAEVDLGRVRGRTASGDLSLRDLSSLSIRSASGDLRFETVAGDADITMASGDVFGAEIGGSLTAAVASGDIRVDSVRGDVDAKSASGDVWLARVTGREVRVKSMSGTVAVGVVRGTRVRLDISTLSGDIHRPTGSSDGTEPTRSMDLTVKTVSGDIRLTRAE